MNIYNTLFILEYSKDPSDNKLDIKFWFSNLNKNCHYHRDFDLYSCIGRYTKVWYCYNLIHRLIGPAIVDIEIGESYYIRDQYMYTWYYNDPNN